MSLQLALGAFLLVLGLSALPLRSAQRTLLRSFGWFLRLATLCLVVVVTYLCFWPDAGRGTPVPLANWQLTAAHWIAATWGLSVSDGAKVALVSASGVIVVVTNVVLAVLDFAVTLLGVNAAKKSFDPIWKTEGSTASRRAGHQGNGHEPRGSVHDALETLAAAAQEANHAPSAHRRKLSELV